MKIKELHLRNIAAIERADIDFERDLCDAVTGLHAPTFLISGDTGTGKSVILDGIAMALYKNTPRLQGVANRTRNEFTSVDGSTLNVFSIEQYTRIGISPSDDCYSEVVFEDNQGTEYRAKLSLGMTQTRTVDAATGRRMLRHSDAVWTVKVGTGDWQNVEARTGEPIQSAIQLTFEQFTRMSMLAQGQFAAFLTGGKDEREKILEQLTNTEKFTKYGDAIDRIYKSAKAAKAQAEGIYETERSHVMPEEVLEKTEKRLQEVKDSYNNLNKELQNVGTQLSGVETIETETAKMQSARAGVEAAETEQKGEAYQSAQRLLADWQQTAQVRQQLGVKDEALRKKGEAEAAIESARATFRQLSADYAARRCCQREAAGEIEALGVWLKEREDRKALYADASAVGVKLAGYKERTEKLANAQAGLAEEKAKTAALQTAERKAKEQYEQAQGWVNKQQQLIDSKTEERKALHPEDLNRQQTVLSNRLHDLGQLKRDYASFLESRRHHEEQERQLEDERLKLNTELTDVTAKAQALVAAKAKAEECNNRFLTMSASLDEKISELRLHLSRGHAEVCPLCGQHLDAMFRDTSEGSVQAHFRNIIDPLEAEKQAADAELRTAEKTWNDAKSTHDSHTGAVNHLAEITKKSAEALGKQQLQVELLAGKVKVALDDRFSQAMESALSEAAERQSEIAASLAEVQKLQNELDKLVKDKKPLDREAQATYRRYTQAQNEVETNALGIKRIETGIKADEAQLQAEGAALDDVLSAFSPQWRTSIELTRTSLKEQAAEYARKSQDHNDKVLRQKAAEQELNAILSSRENIIGAHPEWEEAVEPLMLGCRNIVTEWAKLSNKLSAAEPMLSQSMKELGASQQAIDEYCKASGHDEVYLRTMAMSQTRHDAASQLVQTVNERLTRAKTLSEAAEKAIGEVLERLGAAAITDLPPKAGLIEAKEQLAERVNTLWQEQGTLRQKLDEDALNTKRLNDAAAVLATATERHDKWDKINRHFGGTRFRTLVQTHVLRPLLNNANIYLEMITDRYHLTCSAENEQLSILVHDHYNKNQVRSVTILSGGERFMISLALSLALSSLNRPDLNVDILFIDEGFGTLDEKNLNSVMATLEKLQEIAGQTQRRVGIISHRAELEDRIPVQIKVVKRGEGRSHIEFQNEIK